METALLAEISTGPVGRPSGAVRPRDGLSPKMPQQEAGMRIEPPPSVACAIGTTLAATRAAAPPEEPPELYPVFQGLRVGPCSSGSVVAVRPN